MQYNPELFIDILLYFKPNFNIEKYASDLAYVDLSILLPMYLDLTAILTQIPLLVACWNKNMSKIIKLWGFRNFIKTRRNQNPTTG